jgi:hypothetical protein
MTLDCGRIGIAAQALGIAQVNSTNITLFMLGMQLYQYFPRGPVKEILYGVTTGRNKTDSPSATNV